MKGLITLALSILLISTYCFAKDPDSDLGRAEVDEKYVDEIKTRKAAIERKLEAGNIESGQMYDQEDRQDRGNQKTKRKINKNFR